MGFTRLQRINCIRQSSWVINRHFYCSVWFRLVILVCRNHPISRRSIQKIRKWTDPKTHRKGKGLCHLRRSEFDRDINLISTSATEAETESTGVRSPRIFDDQRVTPSPFQPLPIPVSVTARDVCMRTRSDPRHPRRCTQRPHPVLRKMEIDRSADRLISFDD